MELPPITGLVLKLLQLMLLQFVFLPSPSQQSSNTTDLYSLLAFKATITSDPLGALSSWNDHNRSLPLCRWHGVTCGSPRRHPGRVTALKLDSLNLVGSLSPSLANLTFLTKLQLPDNQFNGQIPQELGHLLHLQFLNLSFNSFSGQIPANLSSCKNLQVLSLSNNFLIGEIPVELGSIPKLAQLSLTSNNLTGTIPPSLGNLSSLTFLSLAENDLEGTIPEILGSSSSLRYLQLTLNQLSGKIPSSFYNISSLYYFNVGDNQLNGTLPPDLGHTLPNLKQLSMYSNHLEGFIPMSLANASGLQVIGLDDNIFTGPVPSNLGSLNDLYWLILSRNKLEAGDWSFFTSLTNCSNLQVLELYRNELEGELPKSISNFSANLNWLTIGQNHIYGSIPMDIDNLIGLNALFMEENLLTGIIPPTIGNLKGLQSLWLFDNRLSGQIPFSIGNLTLLNELYLEVNELQGSIPSSFGKLQALITLNMSYNNLSGEIPKELVSISSLSRYLDLSYNSLTGLLPSEVGKLNNLLQFNVSNNKLSGEIPSSLGECEVLVYLYMDSNKFEGSIPQSLNNLKGIQELNLSNNNLSGPIPESFGELRLLQYLNLSYNNLEGEVPTTGFFANLSSSSVTGNNKLCGGIPELHLPSCSAQKSKKKRDLVMKIVIPLVFALVLVGVLVSIFFFRRRRIKKSENRTSSIEVINDQFIRVSYSDLHEATDGFSSSNLIGTGSFSTVYKGVLESNGEEIAVKVFNLEQEGSSKSFMAECEALRSIRHRNLLKVITACSAFDFEGKEFKAIAYEFMPKGSLDEWLHPELYGHDQVRNLSFGKRLNIAIDVASAMDYLHHYGQTPILHCDLKPSNVLLDRDMTAHVGDFGLARFLSINIIRASQIPTSTVGLKGSIGYVAPEYGMGSPVSLQGDAYSYGILLLEMLTGLRPTDAMFKDDLNLHKHAKMHFPERVKDIIDPALLLQEEHDKISDNIEGKADETARLWECLVSIFGIGIRCSEEEPSNRMQMEAAVKELQAIRESFLG